MSGWHIKAPAANMPRELQQKELTGITEYNTKIEDENRGSNPYPEMPKAEHSIKHHATDGMIKDRPNIEHVTVK